MEQLRQWGDDIRFATRQLRKRGSFAALAATMLALGIGANTAIFTVVHRVLLAPLSYPGGDRIVMLLMEDKDGTRDDPSVAAAAAWRDRATTIETIAAVDVPAMATQDTTEQDTVAAFITANYLGMLGVQPALGREFTAAEERPGSGVAMITYGLWRRSYGGRPTAVGSTIRVRGRPYVIVGVTPKDMGIPMQLTYANAKLHHAVPSVWLPADLDSVGGSVFARLRPGVSAERASRELQGILNTESPIKCCARAVRPQDLLDPSEARAIEVLFVAVGALLLIACGNVANLLMMRAWERRREFALRAALGAGRAQLMRLVLTESVGLSLVSGALGVAVAWATLRTIIALRPPVLASLATVHLDRTVLAWCAAVSVITGILFGSAPALIAGGQSLVDALRTGMYASSDTGARRLRAGLVVAEIALSFVLLVGAGLLVRSFVALQSTPLGFDPHRLLSIEVFLGGRFEEARAVERVVLDRIRATPGVADAAAGTMPGESFYANDTLWTLDAKGERRTVPSYAIVPTSPGYFHVTRISALGASGDTGSMGATGVLINRELARRLWPDGRAIGSTFHDSKTPDRPDGHAFIVTGVVSDVRIPGHTPLTEPTLYRPSWLSFVGFVVRVTDSPNAVLAAVRRAITDADPKAVIQAEVIGDNYVRDAGAPIRFAMALLVAFSAIALTLAAIGLYGLIAYAVTQRNREIGIRIALGAAPATVMRLMARGGLTMAAAGMLVGFAAAALTVRALKGMLYGVPPEDPITFAATALIVSAIALIASSAPARRILRSDPADVLRSD
ncbi:MAG TPA: ADOP family duplicated permease [Gemmatimonadaceae bacterium]|nr:ADOP family duplicated permease [Gemmatimonadaceae bacterium]